MHGRIIPQFRLLLVWCLLPQQGITYRTREHSQAESWCPRPLRRSSDCTWSNDCKQNGAESTFCRYYGYPNRDVSGVPFDLSRRFAGCILLRFMELSDSVRCYHKHTYISPTSFGGHARHTLPPLSPSQPVIADEEIIYLSGNPPEVFCFLRFSWRSFFLFFPRFPVFSFFRCLVFPATSTVLYPQKVEVSFHLFPCYVFFFRVFRYNKWRERTRLYILGVYNRQQ